MQFELRLFLFTACPSGQRAVGSECEPWVCFSLLLYVAGAARLWGFREGWCLRESSPASSRLCLAINDKSKRLYDSWYRFYSSKVARLETWGCDSYESVQEVPVECFYCIFMDEGYTGRVTPWTSCQLVAETHGDKQSFTLTFTTKLSIWPVGRSWRTWENPAGTGNWQHCAL